MLVCERLVSERLVCERLSGERLGLKRLEREDFVVKNALVLLGSDSVLHSALEIGGGLVSARKEVESPLG